MSGLNTFSISAKCECCGSVLTIVVRTRLKNIQEVLDALAESVREQAKEDEDELVLETTWQYIDAIDTEILRTHGIESIEATDWADFYVSANDWIIDKGE